MRVNWYYNRKRQEKVTLFLIQHLPFFPARKGLLKIQECSTCFKNERFRIHVCLWFVSAMFWKIVYGTLTAVILTGQEGRTCASGPQELCRDMETWLGKHQKVKIRSMFACSRCSQGDANCWALCSVCGHTLKSCCGTFVCGQKADHWGAAVSQCLTGTETQQPVCPIPHVCPWMLNSVFLGQMTAWNRLPERVSHRQKLVRITALKSSFAMLRNPNPNFKNRNLILIKSLLLFVWTVVLLRLSLFQNPLCSAWSGHFFTAACTSVVTIYGWIRVSCSTVPALQSTLEQVQHLPRKTQWCWEALAKRTKYDADGEKGSTPFFQNFFDWWRKMQGWQLVTPRVILKGKKENGRRNYFSALCGGSTVACDVSSVRHNVASAWRRPLGRCFLEASVQVDRDPLNSQYLVWKRCSLWLIVNQWREY